MATAQSRAKGRRAAEARGPELVACLVRDIHVPLPENVADFDPALAADRRLFGCRPRRQSHRDRPAWQAPAGGEGTQAQAAGRDRPFDPAALPAPGGRRPAERCRGAPAGHPGDTSAALQRARILLDPRPRRTRAAHGHASDGARARRNPSRHPRVPAGDLAPQRRAGDGSRLAERQPVPRHERGGDVARGPGIRRLRLAQAARRGRRQRAALSQAVLRQALRTVGLGDRFRHLHGRVRSRLLAPGATEPGQGRRLAGTVRRPGVGGPANHRAAAAGLAGFDRTPARRSRQPTGAGHRPAAGTAAARRRLPLADGQPAAVAPGAQRLAR